MLSTFLDRINQSNELMAVVLASAFSVVGFVVLRILSPKARVIWGETSRNHFLMETAPDRKISIQTRNLTFQSSGRAAVENLEITFNWKPEHFEIFPHLHFDQHTNPDGRFIIKFSTLNPKEFVNFVLLTIEGSVPDVTYVRFNNGKAQQIRMIAQRVWPMWVNISALIFMLAGVFTAVYLIVRSILLLL